MRSVDIRDEMRKQGIECDVALDIDGAIHRFDVPGDKRGRKNGWYVFHKEGDKVYGAFGDWKTGLRGTLGGTKAREVMAQVLRDTRSDDEAKHERAALRAQTEWGSSVAIPSMDVHDYLARKCVPALGVRLLGNAIVVPMCRDDVLVGLQKIYPDGQKRFTPGMKKLGSSHILGGVVWMLDSPAPTVVVAEGYATAASIHLATGLPVIVAFDAGNLLPAAKNYTPARFIWAADQDTATLCPRHKADGDATFAMEPLRKDRPSWCLCNPGMSKAHAAARELGGKVAVPPIAGDFNDLHLERGLEAVAEAIYSCL
jgi:putative DNA primase/helicase